MSDRRYRVLYRDGEKTEWSRLQTWIEAEGLLSLNNAVEIVEVKKQKSTDKPHKGKSEILEELGNLFEDIFKRKS